MSLPPYFKNVVEIHSSVAVDTADDYASDNEEAAVCGCRSRNGEKTCVDSSCTNVAMQMECVQCNPRCGNKRIQRREYAKLSVRETPGKGYGLFVEDDVPAGQFLTEYVGELISNKEFSKRLQQRKNEPMMFIMQLKPNTYVDAREKGSVSRFINHSCEPNATTDTWIVEGRLRVGIFTSKPLAAGTELSFDYKWIRTTTRLPTKCLCGAPSCRGFIELPGAPVGAETGPERVGKWISREDAMRLYLEQEKLHDSNSEGRGAGNGSNESKQSGGTGGSNEAKDDSDANESSALDDQEGLASSPSARRPPINPRLYHTGNAISTSDTTFSPYFIKTSPEQHAFGTWLVGKRLRIWWSEGHIYECNVAEFNPKNRKLHVHYLYDDTQEEAPLWPFWDKESCRREKRKYMSPEAKEKDERREEAEKELARKDKSKSQSSLHPKDADKDEHFWELLDESQPPPAKVTKNDQGDRGDLHAMVVEEAPALVPGFLGGAAVGGGLRGGAMMGMGLGSRSSTGTADQRDGGRYRDHLGDTHRSEPIAAFTSFPVVLWSVEMYNRADETRLKIAQMGLAPLSPAELDRYHSTFSRRLIWEHYFRYAECEGKGGATAIAADGNSSSKIGGGDSNGSQLRITAGFNVDAVDNGPVKLLLTGDDASVRRAKDQIAANMDNYAASEDARVKTENWLRSLQGLGIAQDWRTTPPKSMAYHFAHSSSTAATAANNANDFAEQAVLAVMMDKDPSIRTFPRLVPMSSLPVLLPVGSDLTGSGTSTSTSSSSSTSTSTSTGTDSTNGTGPNSSFPSPCCLQLPLADGLWRSWLASLRQLSIMLRESDKLPLMIGAHALTLLQRYARFINQSDGSSGSGSGSGSSSGSGSGSSSTTLAGSSGEVANDKTTVIATCYLVALKTHADWFKPKLVKKVIASAYAVSFRRLDEVKKMSENLPVALLAKTLKCEDHLLTSLRHDVYFPPVLGLIASRWAHEQCALGRENGESVIGGKDKGGGESASKRQERLQQPDTAPAAARTNTDTSASELLDAADAMDDAETHSAFLMGGPFSLAPLSGLGSQQQRKFSTHAASTVPHSGAASLEALDSECSYGNALLQWALTLNGVSSGAGSGLSALAPDGHNTVLIGSNRGDGLGNLGELVLLLQERMYSLFSSMPVELPLFVALMLERSVRVVVGADLSGIRGMG